MVVANNRIRHALFGQFPSPQVASGPGGRLFLTTHALGGIPDDAILLACGALKGPITPAMAAAQMDDMLAAFRARGVDPKVLAVPSSPALHADELPPWLAARCATAVPTLQAVEKARRDDPAVWIAAAAMQAMKADKELYPPTWFHWNGEGLGEIARLSMQRFHGADGAAAPQRILRERTRSDLSFLFPGVRLYSEIAVPDLRQAGISYCVGIACYPELAGMIDTVPDVSRLRNPAPGLRPRLVLISDSFGRFLAPWYARYYSEVIHLCTNGMEQMSERRLAALRAFAVRPGSGDHVLMVYHDVNVINSRLQRDTGLLAP
jgi:hypothetical protein